MNKYQKKIVNIGAYLSDRFCKNRLMLVEITSCTHLYTIAQTSLDPLTSLVHSLNELKPK